MKNKELENAILTLKNYCAKTECESCEIKKTCDNYIYPLDEDDLISPRHWKIED